jgi:coenzyme F420-reducing hydrogenase alpha subunit
MMPKQITESLITKIEGHGSLHVDWANRTIILQVKEGERLFEGILVGRTAEEVHWITPRICGVCPIAHNMAAVKAVEDALGITPNPTTVILRRLMMAGQMIQSHVLHLFFLALPDYIGLDRATDLGDKDPKAFQRALRLKEVADEIAACVAGRNVHPTTTAVGGFHKLPDKGALEKLLRMLEKTSPDASWTAGFFTSLTYPELDAGLELLSLQGGDGYSIYNGDAIVSGRGDTMSVRKYKEAIAEEVRDYSTAKFGSYRKREIMVGALARASINGEKLTAKAKKFIKGLDFNNPFHNVPAQAIEILHFHQEAMELIEMLLAGGMDKTIACPAKNPPLKGIGAIEAPRGGLYLEVHLSEERKVTYANIVTPTVQNLTSLEKSAQALLDQNSSCSQKEIKRLINMLIRAYDPCLTCSVH